MVKLIVFRETRYDFEFLNLDMWEDSSTVNTQREDRKRETVLEMLD